MAFTHRNSQTNYVPNLRIQPMNVGYHVRVIFIRLGYRAIFYKINTDNTCNVYLVPLIQGSC